MVSSTQGAEDIPMRHLASIFLFFWRWMGTVQPSLRYIFLLYLMRIKCASHSWSRTTLPVLEQKSWIKKVDKKLENFFHVYNPKEIQ